EYREPQHQRNMHRQPSAHPRPLQTIPPNDCNLPRLQLTTPATRLSHSPPWDKHQKGQNGISSSISPRLPPAPTGTGLRVCGPEEPKSLPPGSEPKSALPPNLSSMVSCELKPCSTTSVE